MEPQWVLLEAAYWQIYSWKTMKKKLIFGMMGSILKLIGSDIEMIPT